MHVYIYVDAYMRYVCTYIMYMHTHTYPHIRHARTHRYAVLRARYMHTFPMFKQHQRKDNCNLSLGIALTGSKGMAAYVQVHTTNTHAHIKYEISPKTLA